MKKLHRIIGVALVAIVTVFATGCGTAGGLLAKSTERVTVQKYVPVIEQAPDGSAVTNRVLADVEIEQPVYTVAPKVADAVQTAQRGVTAVANFVPAVQPVASAVNTLGGIALGLVSVFAWFKTRLARKNATALETTGAMLRAVVSGVEAVGESKVKEKIAEHASAADIADELHEVVQKITARLQ